MKVAGPQRVQTHLAILFLIIAWHAAVARKVEPKRAAAKKRGRTSSQPRSPKLVDNTSDEKAALSTGLPAVSHVTCARKTKEAQCDTAAATVPKQRGRKAASKPAPDVEAGEEAGKKANKMSVDQLQTEAAAVVPKRRGRPPSKHKAAQASASEQGEGTSAELNADKVEQGSEHMVAVADMKRRGRKISKDATQDISLAAEAAELGSQQAEAPQVSETRGRRKANAAAEPVDTAEAVAVTDAKMKKRGRPVKETAAVSESGRHVRQKRNARDGAGAKPASDFMY